jgi:hypothetical protein
MNVMINEKKPQSTGNTKYQLKINKVLIILEKFNSNLELILATF